MFQRANLDFEGSARIVNLPDPAAAQQPATKAYADALVQAAIEGIDTKDPVRVRTTSNVNLAAPGASLDGVALAAGDRWYADGQTTGADKGVYIWNGSAVAATRAPDANTFAELVNAVFNVNEGTDAGKVFRQSVASGTIGVTTPVLVAFGSTAGAATTSAAGIIELATQGEVDAGSDATRAVTPQTLAAASFRKLKYEALFGDGAATTYTITHNLGTKAVLVQVWDEATGAEVGVDISRTSTNAVVINGFVVAPASNSLRVLVLG